MIDFDKMTKEEHEQYKEMERKAEAFDAFKKAIDKDINTVKIAMENEKDYSIEKEEAELYWRIFMVVKEKLMEGLIK